MTFMPYRMNGQFILEGISGGFFYTLGGKGWAGNHGQQATGMGKGRAASLAWGIVHRTVGHR